MPEDIPERDWRYWKLSHQRQLGEWIRALRLSRRQIHNGRPWAQEDLAVAIGSDKSHINRIERGHQLPTCETLQRICDALELPWEDRCRLLSVAGYLAPPPSPSPAEVDAAVRLARPFLQSAQYPVALVDQEQRFWDLNDLMAYAFFGYPRREAFLDEARGLRCVQLLSLDHPIGWWLRQVIENYDSFARREVALFRSVLRYWQHSPQYRSLMKEVLSDGHLLAIWKDPRSNRVGPMEPESLDHQLLKVDHPEIGPYTVHLWQARLAADDRFSLVHLMPIGDRTRRMMGVLGDGLRRWSTSSSEVGPKALAGRDSQTACTAVRTGGAVDFPSRPITLMVPWPVGGTTDFGARIVASIAEKELGQPIVVVNREGACSQVGLAELAAQEPDGYHLGFVNLPAFNSKILSPGQKPPFGLDSFTFIINQVYDPTAVFVRPESPYKSLQELIEDAKRRPEQITVGTSGPLTPAHLGALLLEKVADIRFRFVHYEGSASHIARFFGGETDVAFFTPGITLPAVRTGKLRVLAVYTKERFDLLPEVPTTAELGYPTLMMASTRGIAAPRGVPKEIARKLESVFRSSMESPEHVQRMANAGFGLKLMAGEEYFRLVYRQGRLYRDLIPHLMRAS
ncbi:MAG: tripartite tricarboxylate transporter substrate-binding protein [Sphingomonadaceae bacterium]